MRRIRGWWFGAVAVLLAAGIIHGQEALNLGPVVNSEYDDFSPVVDLSGNNLYFTSDRPGGHGGQDIWVSHREPGGAWGPPVNLGPEINTPFNEGPDCLSVDDKTLYYTHCERSTEPGTCDIYMAEWNESAKKWTNARSLGPNINTNYNDSNSTVTADGKFLFFVSDRLRPDKSRKDYDIYVSKREGVGWGRAEPLGESVNTPGDEFHVWVLQDKKDDVVYYQLYFSSTGHAVFGGSDIFVSRILPKEQAAGRDDTVESTALPGWVITKPRNLGPPYNSSEDDMYFSVPAAKDMVYLASDREGTIGRQDIYVLPYEPELPDKGVIIIHGIVADRTTCAPPSRDPRTGIEVYDIRTCRPIPGAVVRLAESTSDRVIKQGKTGPDGRYKVVVPSGRDYVVSATAKGYSFHSERINTLHALPFEMIEKNILLDPARPGMVFVLNNIYFDFDKATLRPESKAELNNAIRWLQENPHVRIEIAGHTDWCGSDAYNIRLSQARAQAVVNYLTQVGRISPARLIAHGYGERFPIASNETDEGRQLNRRVEFRILE